MLKFNDTITLSNKIEIVVPQNHELSLYYTDSFLATLSVMFGGATATKCDGCYVMEDGRLEKDQNVIVYAYYNTMSDEQAETLTRMVLEMKEDLNQESIGVAQNGVFQIVF